MNIEITENYRVRSGQVGNLIVDERRWIDPSKSPHYRDNPADAPPARYEWFESKYYGTFEQACVGIFRLEVNASPAQSVAELRKDMARIEAEIKQAIQP